MLFYKFENNIIVFKKNGFLVIRILIKIKKNLKFIYIKSHISFINEKTNKPFNKTILFIAEKNLVLNKLLKIVY